MKTKNLFSNVLKKLAPIALTGMMLVACGKNNKVGGPGGPGGPGIYNGVSGMYSPGQIGVQAIDQAIANNPCIGGAQYNQYTQYNQYNNQYGQYNQGTGQRVAMTFMCQGTNAFKTCNRSGVGAYSSGNVRLGRSGLGNIAIYKDNGPSGELTLLVCVDAIFNPSTINNFSQVGIKILNANVTMNGAFGDLIADIAYPQITGQSYCSQMYPYLCDAMYGVRR